MPIVLIWSLRRGSINPHERLDPDMELEVEALWFAQDNPASSRKLKIDELEWNLRANPERERKIANTIRMGGIL